MNVAELILQFSSGVKRMDRIRNEYVRVTAQERRFRDSEKETRLRWLEHGHRRDARYIGKAY